MKYSLSEIIQGFDLSKWVDEKRVPFIEMRPGIRFQKMLFTSLFPDFLLAQSSPFGISDECKKL